MASEVTAYYENRPYVVLVVLKGAFVTSSDLFAYLQEAYSKGSYVNCVLPEFVRLKSYSDENTTGKVQAIGLDCLDLKGKEVLVVEDIVDTGVTMRFLLGALKEKEVKDVKLFSLLLKEGKVSFEFNVDFVGFVIPNKFVVGYGLDYNEYFRDLKHICILNSDGKKKFKQVQNAEGNEVKSPTL